MNCFDKRKLNKISSRAVVQGNHKHNITLYYKIIVANARAEFTEDNKITLDNFLRECHEESLK